MISLDDYIQPQVIFHLRPLYKSTVALPFDNSLGENFCDDNFLVSDVKITYTKRDWAQG